ncbi:MAG: Na+/H+ antiporter NhaA [Rhodospirillales bacterium]|nr:Na+/H+ antiporter NhaA [Rhodospirillales bacterium]
MLAASAPFNALRDFFRMEAAGGILLVIAAAIAVVVANSAAAPVYQAFLDLPVQIRVGAVDLHKPLLLWINDGLMAVFFFLVGLEVKREFLEGELSTTSQAMLPGVAAIGGMAVPALIYVVINLGAPMNLNGWAIPAATDIGFALGILALLGRRVPLSLKILLTAIAIFDDLGAIIIIATFYTAQLSVEALGVAGLAIAVLVALNLFGVTRTSPYIVIGAVMWVAVLKSGVHATLAGVVLAMTIPLRTTDAHGHSPLKHLEHELHRWVAFGVLPIFAFANAGVSFAGIGLESLLEPVTLGIAAGLFIGKQIGVFGCFWLMIRRGFASMPDGATYLHLYGVALLCGIGFTMSLFIGGLAWEHAQFDAPVRLGVITGSLLSAVTGFLVLLLARKPRPVAAEPAPQP